MVYVRECQHAFYRWGTFYREFFRFRSVIVHSRHASVR